MSKRVKEPIKRGALRLALGKTYYSALRRLLWLKMRGRFARERSDESLPFVVSEHATPLLRKLKDVDMWMQHNKITNLRLAAEKLDGITVRPGETLSYWYLIGKPSKRRGYLDGMILRNGKVMPGVGGGLCQMSNLIFWLTLHTPLTIAERHRHGYDVFPDSNRTQPFGSGATCYYPYGDLMIRNDTQDIWQLRVRVEEKVLAGQWLCSCEQQCRWEVAERGHEMRSQYWGGYTRHNEILRQCFSPDGAMISEELVAVNDAIMMYSPFLEQENE